MAPCKNFGELSAIVNNMFPGMTTVLRLPATSGQRSLIIGSQDELTFAYQDVPDNATTLELEAQLQTKSQTKKRPIEQVESDDSAVESESETTTTSAIRAPEADGGIYNAVISGPWSSVEMEFFKTGVAMYGWGKWKLVSAVIGTRTAEQTRKFSGGKWARKFKLVASTAVTDLANAVKNVSEALLQERE
jgi:hypothetical protein